MCSLCAHMRKEHPFLNIKCYIYSLSEQLRVFEIFTPVFVCGHMTMSKNFAAFFYTYYAHGIASNIYNKLMNFPTNIFWMEGNPKLISSVLQRCIKFPGAKTIATLFFGEWTRSFWLCQLNWFWAWIRLLFFFKHFKWLYFIFEKLKFLIIKFLYLIRKVLW